MEHDKSSSRSKVLIHSDDDQDVGSSRKHHKAKQKRKSSTVSVKDGGKTQSRGSKSKPSLAQIEQEMPAVSEIIENDNVLSVDDNYLPTPKLLQDEHESKSPEIALNLMEMTIDEQDIQQSLPTNEITSLTEDEPVPNDENAASEAIAEEEVLITKEEEQSNVHLDEKLNHDDEYDIRTIMDLSSSNVTGNDIPRIIDQIFHHAKKKYTGLILRDNGLTSADIKILVDELLKTPTSLKNLVLSNNSAIEDVGIEHLIRLLQGSRSITILGLHNTGITDRSVRLLADALCKTDTNPISPLEKLYISFNKSITDESLPALIQILEQNRTLKVFSLQHCSLSDRARRRLRQIGAKTKKKKFSLSE